MLTKKMLDNWTAFCLLKAKKYNQLLKVNNSSSEITFLKACTHLLLKDEDEALNLILQNKSSFIKTQNGQALAIQLLTKNILTRLSEKSDGDGADYLFSELKGILKFDQNYTNQVFHLWSVFPYQIVSNISETQIVFEQIAKKEPFDPDIAHAWGVFSNSVAHNLLEKGMVEEAYTTFEIVISNFAYVLLNDCFWINWTASRKASYNAEINSDHISYLKSKIEKNIMEFVTQKMISSNNSKAKDLSWRLNLAWELELEAVKSLMKTKGFKYSKNGKSHEIGFGPLFMKHRNLEARLKEFINNNSKQKSRNNIDFIYQLLKIYKDKPIDELEKPDNKELKKIKRMFSCLGICEALVLKKHFEESLGFLENDAFTENHDNELFESEEITQLQFEMTTDTQLLIAEQLVRKNQPDLEKAVGSWQLALASSKKWNGYEVTKRKIINTSIGRAQTLRKKDIDDAIQLLEAVYSILSDGKVSGFLVELLRNRAIKKANRSVKENNVSSLETNLPDLRKAMELNPHSKQIILDLYQILRSCSYMRYDKGEKDKAISLINEALKTVEGGLVYFRNDIKLKKYITEAKQNLRYFQGPTKSISNIDQELLEMLNTILSDKKKNPESMAKRYNKQGVEKAKRGDFIEAIEDFEKAVKLDATFQLAKDNLKATMMEYLFQLFPNNKNE